MLYEIINIYIFFPHIFPYRYTSTDVDELRC